MTISSASQPNLGFVTDYMGRGQCCSTYSNPHKQKRFRLPPRREVPMPNSENSNIRSNSGIRCPAVLQNVLLALLLLHFLGVLSEPLRFFSRSEVRTGPEFAMLSDLYKPYSQWLYINHGYFFFAPNPGPGHLIECTIQPQVSQTESSQTLLLPDRKAHWPRLLYHRYFMLAEFYNSRFAPATIGDEEKKDPEFVRRWAYDKELYDQLQSLIVSSLKHSQTVERIELKRLERLLPDSQQVLKEGWTLNDPRLISVLSETLQDAAVVPVDELPSKTKERKERVRP